MPDNRNDNIPIKKVQPSDIDTEDNEEDDVPDVESEQPKERFGGIKNMFRGGFNGLKGSWFGAKPVVSSVSAACGKCADALNLPKKAVSAGLAIATLGTAVGGGAFITNYNHQNLLLKQEAYVDECYIDANAAQKKAIPPLTGDEDARQQEIARKLWAFGKAAGMTDYQCAGMLGNYNQESGLDPTAIELVTDGIATGGSNPVVRYIDDPEAFRGTRQYEYIPLVQDTASGEGKYHGSQKMDMDFLVSKYHGISIDRKAYEADGDGTPYWGIGLLQWTGPTAYDFLEFASKCHDKDSKYDWISLEVQIAVLLSDTTQISRFNAFLADKGNANSIEGGTASWLGFMERGAGHAVFSGFQYENRLSFAKHWYNLLSPDSEAIAAQYGDIYNSVMSLAAAGANSASAKHSNKLLSDCKSDKVEDKSADNSGIANAAVAYAWETKDMGRGNNGTALYKAVKDAVYPGDGIYQSCDRGAATAVVWSGADDNYPVGNTSTQYEYMLGNSDLFEDKGTLNSVGDDGLEPGDILCCPNGSRAGTAHGHILIFTGNEIIKEKYPSSNAQTVSASYNERSPGCGDDGGCMASYGKDGNAYHVFRYSGSYGGSKKDAYNGDASGTSQ